MSAQIQKLRKRRRKWGIPYLQYLLSRSTATHSEAMLPGKCLSTACWWEIAKNVPFWGFFLHTCDHCLVNCLYLDPQEVFSILFSPTSHPMSCWGRERQGGLLGIWCPVKVNIPQLLSHLPVLLKEENLGNSSKFSGFSCPRSLALLWWRQKINLKDWLRGLTDNMVAPVSTH